MDQAPIIQPPIQNTDTTGPAEQPPATRPPDERVRGARQLALHLPTAVVLTMLAGLGLFGHHFGWKLPKFSQLLGTAAAGQDDWCAEHGVPESQCVECRPNLLPRCTDYGWCKEHGIHNCPLEHPQVAQLKQTAAVADADRQRAARALACRDRPENNKACTNYRRRIQFASVEAVKKAGVDVAIVARQPISETVAANGEITYDPTRVACLSSRLPGTVWRVEKNVGDRVAAGEVLCLVEAVEVGRAKTELIQTLAEEELKRKIATRIQPLSTHGEVPAAALEKAEAERIQAKSRLLAAQQVLGNLGLPVDLEELRRLPEEQWNERLRLLGLSEALAQHPATDTATNLLPLRASRAGVVVECHAVAGEAVDTSRVLFQLADTSRVWVTLSVPPEDVRWLAEGQPVRFRPDGSAAEVEGRLAWISTTADPKTRMIAVRAELPNPRGLLRNATFGQGRIVLREEPEAVVVPREAVHTEGCCSIVFVRDQGYFDPPDSPKVFHVREVRLGAKTVLLGPKNVEGTEIIAGILPWEVVATRGSDVLRAELLKHNLGEGCCCGK